MVQVLPATPTFGQNLIEALSQAGSQVSEGLLRRGAGTRIQGLLARTGLQGSAPTIENQINEAANSGKTDAPPLTIPDIVGASQDFERLYGKNSGAVMGALVEQVKENNKENREIQKEERNLGYGGTKEFFEKIESDRLKIPDEQLASDMILESIKSGEIDPFSSAHVAEIAKDLGAPESILKILETPGSKEFKTARKTFIGNTIKDAFKGTTSKTEINLAEDMLAELGVSREGNLASAWGIQAALDIKKERLRLTDQLKSEGVSPSKIPATVDKMLQPYIKETKGEYFDALKTLRK